MSDFKKIIFSGTCLCGHTYDHHHLGIIASQEAADIMGPYLPLECVFFGSNEDGGLDENGNGHCGHYIDMDNPDEELKSQWHGTKR